MLYLSFLSKTLFSLGVLWLGWGLIAPKTPRWRPIAKRLIVAGIVCLSISLLLLGVSHL